MTNPVYTRFWLLIAVALTLGACTVNTIPTTADQRLYVLDRAITEAMTLATDLRQQRLIPDSAWVSVKTSLRQASSLLDEAWLTFQTDPVGNSDRLQQINVVLEEVKQRLLAYQQQQVN